MKYEILDSQYTVKYRDSYKAAIDNDKEAACFIGREQKYRMIGRDSVLLDLTDPKVLLEYCIYPLYEMGDIEIGIRIGIIIRELISSKDVVTIYQVVKFIYTQDKLSKRYEELPVFIQLDDVVNDIVKEVNELCEDMKDYREGQFKSFPKNVYEMIQSMMKKSKTFIKSL